MMFLTQSYVLEPITKSFTDAVSAAITLVIGAAALAIVGWIKAKLSAPVQRQVVLEEAIAEEQEQEATGVKLSGPEKKARVIARVRKKLPFMHTAIMPLGPKVEDVMPEVKRKSQVPPPPAEPTSGD